MYAYNSLDGAQGVPATRSLYFIELCRIADCITCLKSVSILLKFVRRSITLLNIIYICLVVFCHNFYIPVF